MVPGSRPPQDRNKPAAERLPLRWVVIALLAVAAGVVGHLAAGSVTAIVTACTVVTVLHKIIA
jgi:hypothetical protein